MFNKTEFIKDSISDDYVEQRKAIDDVLKSMNIGIYVLKDINICVDKLNAFVDYVIITSAHAYLASVCNQRDLIDLTVAKANKNVEIMKYYRDAKRSRFLNAINRFMGNDVYYQPLVIVSKDVEDIKSDFVVSIDGLSDYLIQDIENTRVADLDSKDVMYNMSQYILLADYPCKDGYMERLKEYRIKKAQEINCLETDILNNDELDRIVNIRPSSINELFDCLDADKVKKYGDDILDLIKIK